MENERRKTWKETRMKDRKKNMKTTRTQKQELIPAHFIHLHFPRSFSFSLSLSLSLFLLYLFFFFFCLSSLYSPSLFIFLLFSFLCLAVTAWQEAQARARSRRCQGSADDATHGLKLVFIILCPQSEQSHALELFKKMQKREVTINTETGAKSADALVRALRPSVVCTFLSFFLLLFISSSSSSFHLGGLKIQAPGATSKAKMGKKKPKKTMPKRK